jgi:hypothetical protein
LLLSVDLGKHEDDIKKVSFEKTIYRMDSFDKEILGYSNPIQSVGSRQSHPRSNVNESNVNFPVGGKVYKNKHHNKHVYSVKRGSKLESD